MAVYGRFIPKFPEKYVGDANKIFFRSSWEISVMKWLDGKKNVIKWGSEEIKISYLNPIDCRVHTYIPDFFAEISTIDNQIKKVIIEVKPRHESFEKYAKSDRDKDRLVVNNAKWKAAQLWCEAHGLEFKVITEDSIFWQGEKKPKKKRKKKEDVENGQL